MSRKNTTYVLDTNVLLCDVNIFNAIDEGEILLPFVVIEELDKHKVAKGALGAGARNIIRQIDVLAKQGDILKGCVIHSKLKLRIASRDDRLEAALDKQGLDNTPDNQILATAVVVKEDKKKVVLLTNDLALRIKAKAAGITAGPYDKDQKANSIDEVYSGARTIVVSSQEVDELYKTGQLVVEDTEGFLPNEYFKVVSSTDEKHTALGRFTGSAIALLQPGQKVSGIKPRNIKQTMALDALLNPDITMVSLLGLAGTGKTIMALASALELVMSKKLFKRVILVKSPISMPDSELGFLPGSAREKLLPHYANFLDNLSVLFPNKAQSIESLVDHLIEIGVLELAPPTYMRGRSLPDSIIIIDEFQNLSPYVAKAILTRVGENSRVFILGDINQIDNERLDAFNNGLYHALEAFKDEPCAAHITLDKSERSSFADLAARKL